MVFTRFQPPDCQNQRGPLDWPSWHLYLSSIRGVAPPSGRCMQQPLSSLLRAWSGRVPELHWKIICISSFKYNRDSDDF